MNTKSSNVSTCLTWNSEDTESFFGIELKKFRFIDGSDSEFSFDGWDFWRLLEQASCQSTQNFFQTDFVINWTMESDNTNILFTSRLLGFDQTGSSKSLIIYLPFKTDDKTSGNFRIQSSWVTSLLDSKDSLDPSDNFVRTWVWWFIQIDATILQIFFQWSFEWGWTGWDWSVMIGKNVHFVVVFKQEWPFRGVHWGILIGRFDKELLLSFNLFFDFFLNELFTLFLIFAHEVVDINFYGKWLYLF